MRNGALLIASVAVSLVVLAGVLALDAMAVRFGPSAGAALVVAALTAFLISYDIIRREPRKPAVGKSAADTPVTPLFDRDSAVEIEAAVRDGIAYMTRKLSEMGAGGVPVLRITMGRAAKYDIDSLKDQLNVLARRTAGETFVYVVRSSGQFVCFTTAERLLAYLKHPEDGRALISLLNTGIDEPLKDFPDLTVAQLSRKTTHGAALRKLAADNTPRAMIVHEVRGTPIGPIDWPTLVRRVLPARNGQP